MLAAEEHALLIGCTEYPGLKSDPYYETSIRLYGPGNDVKLMSGTLRRFLGVKRITVLAGWPKDEAARPTRANIIGHLDRLADTAKKGDRVIVYFAGHGSQQPDTNRDEIDGLDEIFLPADAKGWNGKKGEVENSITDDELGAKLRAIRARGARVWLLLDCCHSGSGVRGVGERSRGLEAANLGIPDAAIARARRGAIASGAVKKESIEGIVAMYGAQSHRTAPELMLPKNADNADWHGAFTFVLVGQLQRTGGNLTFRELHARTLAAYRAIYHGTAPQAEGELDERVAGDGAGERAALLIRREKGGYVLNTGRLAGVEKGTILAAVRDGKRIGYVEVTQADLIESKCKAITRDGLTLKEEMAPAEIVSRSPGSLRLKIACVEAEGGKVPAPKELRDLEFVELVAQRSDADWVIVPRGGGRVWLEPAQGSGARLVATLPSLRRHLERVFRSENLTRFAGAGLMNPLPAGFEVTIAREGGAKIDPGAVVHPGEKVQVEIANRSKLDLDVTILAIDSQCGITEVYPRRDSARLPAGSAKQVIGPFEVLDNTLGIEHLVVIAVPRSAGQDPAWYGWLAQESLPTERGTINSLDSLLRAMAFGEGIERGHSASSADACAALLTWRTAWQPIALPKRFPGKPAKVGRQRALSKVPDAWAIGPHACLHRNMLLAGDDAPRFVLIDVDGDTSPAPVETLVERRAFDAEVAFHFLDDRRIAFYDTDDSGEFDLILVDNDADPDTDVEYRLIAGQWKVDAGTRKPWLRAHHLRFEDGPERALPILRKLAR
jgi:hypothetical protein